MADVPLLTVRNVNRAARNLVRRLPVLADEYLTARLAFPGPGSLRRYRAAERCRLNLVPRDIPLDGHFVDVGANVGDWTAAALDVAPRARITALEPAPAPYRVLHSRFHDDARVTALPCAAGESTRKAMFYVTTDTKCSSFLAPRPMGDTYGGPGWEVDERAEVDVRPLDELISGDVTVLKLDVQGAERQALAGAAKTLRHTAAVLLEVTFESHYAGDATFPRLHEEMTERGFEIVGLSEPFSSPYGQLLWLDACYRNREISGTRRG